MFVRLTFCKFLPEKMDEVRKIFTDEIFPAVRKQKGLINIKLLEPADKAGDYISITEWASMADADLYDSSGVYKQLVDKLDSCFDGQPELKTYTVQDVLEHA